MTTDRLRIAVFIDFDNIEIGVKNTMGASFDAGLVLEALKERGEVVSKTAYSDWQRAGGYSRALTQHAIRMVQRNMTPGGDKNGADINLALDALEMAFTHPHINAFVIVGGDSDFISLVEKLKQYDKKIFVVGGRQFTSAIMQRNCHEFIAYENLMGAGGGGGQQRRPAAGREARVERGAAGPIDQAIPLVARALKVLSEREVSPQIGLLKSTLLQLDSTFSERNYGAGSFRDFVQKLEQLGVVRVYQAKGNLLVGLPDDAAAASPPAEEGDAHAANAAVGAPAAAENGSAPAATSSSASASPAPAVTGTPAQGVAELARVLASAEIRRWPMYLRNVKQVMRQAAPAFDERTYGFGSLVDLLRAAHKDGVVRVDRDRQGVIRVFQGQGSATPATRAIEPSSPSMPEFETPMSASDVEPAVMSPAGDADDAGDLRDPYNVMPPAVPQSAEPDVDELPDDNIGNVAPPPRGTSGGGARPRGRRRGGAAPASTTQTPRGAQTPRGTRTSRAPRARRGGKTS